MAFLTGISEQKLSDNIAKQVITMYLETRKPLQECLDTFTSVQSENIDLPSIIHEVLQNNVKVVDEYKAGKKTTIGFLI
jgi:Asp-tRNA(Asn)/Glu-tRNA(Gln) amidotransferase B subunit